MNFNIVETGKNIPECMKIYKMALDNHLQQLKECIAKRLAREQRQYTTEPQAILDTLRWHNSNWLSYPKRQMYSDTWYIAETITRTAPDQAYGNGENETPCMWINILATYY